MEHPQIRKDQSEEFARKYPHHHETLFARPHWTRRRFFQVAGAGLAGSYLARKANASAPAPVITSQGMTTKNTAKNCIFILLTGAISVVDTFDLKVTSVTPSNFNPTMVGGINWPMGLLPKLGARSYYETKIWIPTAAAANTSKPCTRTCAGWGLHGAKARTVADRMHRIRKTSGERNTCKPGSSCATKA